MAPRFPAPSRQGFVSPFRLIAGLLAVSAFAADLPLDRLLKQVENRYNHAKTLQVLFVEQYTPPANIRRTERGSLLLRKPGRMRWDYTEPKGKLWVSDGKDWWLYTPADHRAETGKLKESGDLHPLLAFLLGKLDFSKEFRNLKGTPLGPDMHIVAEPKSDNLPYSAVELVVTPDDHIRQVKVTGFDHSILEFSLSEEKLDLPLDPKLFQFKLPPGTILEDAGQ